MIFNTYKEKIKEKLFEGSKRTQLAKFNIMAMFVIKGLSILLQLVLLPMTVNYVSSSTYGIWLSLSSIVAWMSFFDVGLNNGLKNRYIQSIAVGDYDKAKILVSTTYAILILIFAPVAIIALLINSSINWSTLLNIANDPELTKVVSIIIVYFACNFIFQTANVIMTAEQKPAYVSIVNFLQQLTTFIVIFILTHTTSGSLMNLCLALCLSPLFVIIIYNLILYRGKYKKISPSISCIDFAYARDLFSLGIKFFVIQVSFIILYQTSNFLMIRFYGPESVTLYNVAYKYFFCLNMVFNIIITPVWAAVTDAISQNDYAWIRNMIIKYAQIIALFIIGAFIMLIISAPVYRIWMGDSINKVPFTLSLCVCIYVCITICGSFTASILNGAGVLKLQFLNCIIAPIIFILSSLLFVKVLHMDVYAIPLSIIISSIYSFTIAPIQCYLVFFKNKKGIWAK